MSDTDIYADLIALCEKHGIKDASFCGTEADGKYIAIMNCNQAEGKGAASSWMPVSMNVGRMWQHVRDATKQILDGYEKSWHNRKANP
jgi:hypothetical protein